MTPILPRCIITCFFVQSHTINARCSTQLSCFENLDFGEQNRMVYLKTTGLVLSSQDFCYAIRTLELHVLNMNIREVREIQLGFNGRPGDDGPDHTTGIGSSYTTVQRSVLTNLTHAHQVYPGGIHCHHACKIPT
jgi:hypothetical protein